MESLRFVLTSSFYPPYHVGGDAICVKYLAEELVRLGHEVHVLHSLDSYRVKRKGNPPGARAEGVCVHRIQTPFSLGAYAAYVLGNSSVATRHFDLLVREVKPDVVHHHNPSLLGYKILAKRDDYLNLYTIHDFWPICPQSNLLWRGLWPCEDPDCFLCGITYKRPPQLWRRQPAFKRAILDIDVAIASSNYVKERIARVLPLRQITIPNFVPSPPNSVPPSGFDNFFLYVGMLEKHKGAPQLIEAFSHLEHGLGYTLLLVGSGSLKAKIQDQIRRLGLQKTVFQFDWMDLASVYRLLNDANALIIPSVWPENCPLIALQALSLGKTVIASNKGGLPEIVGKIDRNLLFQSRDGLVNILTNFKPLPAAYLKAVHQKYYSATAYLRQYMELIRLNLNDDGESYKHRPLT